MSKHMIAAGKVKGTKQRTTCKLGCPGLEIEPGVFSGCSCAEGRLANGGPIPPGFKCDCPNHPE